MLFANTTNTFSFFVAQLPKITFRFEHHSLVNFLLGWFFVRIIKIKRHCGALYSIFRKIRFELVEQLTSGALPRLCCFEVLDEDSGTGIINVDGRTGAIVLNRSKVFGKFACR